MIERNCIVDQDVHQGAASFHLLKDKVLDAEIEEAIIAEQIQKVNPFQMGRQPSNN